MSLVPPSGTFNRRIYSPKMLMASLSDALAHLDDFRLVKKIDHAFSKRIILAVTGVNGCRYCSYFHSRQALTLNLTPSEVQQLQQGSFEEVPEDEVIAVTFAQHYAESQGHPDPIAWQRLVDQYGPETARAIMANIRMITMGNLLGNTFDAFLSRLQHRPAPESSATSELGVFSLTLTVLPAAMAGGIVARTLDRSLHSLLHRLMSDRVMK